MSIFNQNTLRNIILPIIVSLISLTGCINDNISDPVGDMISFDAITEQPLAPSNTRTSLGDETSGTTPVLWNNGDKIRIYTNGSSSEFITYALTDDKTKAKFIGSSPGAIPTSAIFPSSMADNWNENRITIPSTQIYTKNNVAEESMPMYAKITNEYDPIEFRNLCGIVKINITKQFLLTKSVVVKKIILTSDDPIAGKASIEYNAGNPKLSFYSGTSNSITLDCGAGVQLNSYSSSPTVFHIVVPPTSTNKFTVKVVTDSDEAMVKSADSADLNNNIDRNVIISMPRITFDENVFIDMTSNGTANSYMLRSNGTSLTYHIPVEGRINTFWREYSPSQNILPDGALYSTDEWVPEILWHDSKNADDINNLKIERVTSGYSGSSNPKNGYFDKDFTTQINGKPCYSAMKITVPKNFAGNVVVAVKFKGTILWSWHLWIIDGDIPNNTWISTNDGSLLMERNLGAIGSGFVNDYGRGVLYYQFGRKDPFPGKLAYFNDGNGNFSRGSAATNYLKSMPVPKTVSIATSIQNPTIFYNGGRNWCNEVKDSKYLWNDKNITTISGKSFFDPSPLGWKLPINGWIDNSDFTLDIWDKGKIIRYSYFYYAGQRRTDNAALEGNGKTAHYWSSTVAKWDNTRVHHLYFDPDVTDASNTAYRSSGFVVRPIRE